MPSFPVPRSRIVLLAGTLVVVGCGGDSSGPGGPAVTSIAITPSTFTLHPTATRTLVAVATDADDSVHTGVTLTWESRTPGVATVSPEGLVTAVGLGVDTITATDGHVTGQAILTVVAVPVDSVSVAPAVATVHLTQSRQLTPTTRDSAGGVLVGRTITWSSSDSSRATVSGTGLVTALAVGPVTITATSEGKQGSATLTIDSIPVASVALVPAGDTLAVGDTIGPVAVAKDSAGNVIPGLSPTWTVSDSGVLQPIAGARFVALANGVVTLTATIRGVAHGGTVDIRTCGDTVAVAAGSFNFPLISGGLATDGSGVIDIGTFKGNAAWYGGGVMYGTDSAHMVVAYDPSLNLGRGVAGNQTCTVAAGPPYLRSYSKVTPLAGLAGPTGLRVVEEAYVASSTSDDTAFVLFRYTFTNTTGTAIAGLRTGFIVDWDLGLDPANNFLGYSTANATHLAVEADSIAHTERLGVIAFSATGLRSSAGWLNGTDPGTRGGYYTRLAAGNQTGASGPGDVRALAGVPAVTVPAYGRVVVYFALIGGTNAAKFTTSKAAAKALADALGYN